MELIDTHAHLYAKEFKEDIAAVIDRSLAHHVRKVYLPNIDASTMEAMLQLAARYPAHCAAMAGIHPCHVEADFEQHLQQIEGYLAQHQFAAIGEVGMDLYHDKTYQKEQEAAFARQLSWARQYQLPVVIHCRASLDETLAILAKHQDGSLRGIFHCFSGSLQDAQRIIDLGFYLGIGGIVTFKNAGLDQVVAKLSLDHLVLETDAPYLAPTPYRGQRNEPAYLLYIAEKIAEIKGIDLATVAEKTTANARQVFERT